MNYYGVFLMIELAKVHGIIKPKLEYDLMWEKGLDLYNQFVGSDFNDTNDSEYHCIHSFLLYKVKTRLDKAIENLADRGVSAKIENGTVYVYVGDVELELSDDEIDYNVKEYEEKDWD